MSQHDPRISMMQMRDHAREAIEMATGRDREDLDGDRQLRLALERLVEIVGEAARRVPDDVQSEHASVPWAEAIGYRNRLAHGYDTINLNILWETIRDDLPRLVASLDAILD